MSFTPPAIDRTCRAVWREETLYQPGRRTSPITETRIPFIWPSVTSEETSAIVETFDRRYDWTSENVFPAT